MNTLEHFKQLRDIEETLHPIALHDVVLSKCSLILVQFPMKKTKLDIYATLNKHQRVGMLFRHILGVASKLGIYTVILKNIKELRSNHKRYKSLGGSDGGFWEKRYKENNIELGKQYSILLDIIIEEISRREKPKYIRKKKLEKLKLQN